MRLIPGLKPLRHFVPGPQALINRWPRGAGAQFLACLLFALLLRGAAFGDCNWSHATCCGDADCPKRVGIFHAGFGKGG